MSSSLASGSGEAAAGATAAPSTSRAAKTIPSPEKDPDDSVNQETTSMSYSSLAAKTVANIRRLQENVASSSNGVSTVWVGNHQVVPENVQQVVSSPPPPPDQLAQQHSWRAPVNSTASPTKKPTPPQSPLPSISPTLASAFNALVTIDPNWQSGQKSMRERNAIMCNNALMADVYFNVGAELGSPKKFPGHKYVLATGSSVFYAMFFGGLAEEGDVIEVPDVEPAAFLTMLRYLYYDEILLTNDNVLATLYCSKRYLVPHLAGECVRFLENSLTARNACVLLSQSRLFEEPELMERSWEVIDAQAQLALLSDSFSDVDLDTLKAVLARESLNCRETCVFRAALQWAGVECDRRGLEPTPANRREVLGPAMHLIRFPAMSVQEFADEVVPADVLSLRETTDIFMHFTSTKSKPEVLYPSRPRRGLQMQRCHRFQSSAYRSNQWRYRGRCDSIQFCVDRRVFIIGFGLYGSSNGSSDYTAKIELKSSTCGRSLAENNCKFFSDGSSSTFQVFFEQPVQVEPDQFYTASVILDGSELSYFGQEGMTEVMAGCVTFQFQCSAESTNGTGVQGGQIPELVFYGPICSNRASNSEPSGESVAKDG